MDKYSADPDPANAPRHTLPRLELVRDCPANGNNPYSPLLCLSLLLAVGLIIKIAKGPLLLAALLF